MHTCTVANRTRTEFCVFPSPNLCTNLFWIPLPNPQVEAIGLTLGGGVPSVSPPLCPVAAVGGSRSVWDGDSAQAQGGNGYRNSPIKG